MRTVLIALSVATGIGLALSQSAGAVPASGTAMQQAATAASTVEQAQYSMRVGRHGIRKCYNDVMMAGRYSCHYYRYHW
jgi:hypothetical protein